MATLSKTSSGGRSIQFEDREGKRRTISLGQTAHRAADMIRRHVEELLAAGLANRTPGRETSEWVGGVGDALHAKLARVGLVESRAARAAVLLGAYFDAYAAKRADLKPRSRANLAQARRLLVGFLGENRDLRELTRGDLADWHRDMKAKGLSPATIGTHVKRARQVFADAVDRKLIAEDPTRGIKAGKQSNAARFFYVTERATADVLAACPDAEWRAIVALARFGGLRVPSETRRLRWADVDWARGRMLVTSPKTEHHAGRDKRWVPLFPPLVPPLRDAFEAAPDGAAHVVARHRGENLGTRFAKIIARAGHAPWPKLWQNLRSSCETDLTTAFPLHVACAWIGNTEAVAVRHYLQVTEQHFSQASGVPTPMSDATPLPAGESKDGVKGSVPPEQSGGPGAAPGAANTDEHGRTLPAPECQNPALERGLAGRQYPQGGYQRGVIWLEKSGIPKGVLRRVLRRTRRASGEAIRRQVVAALARKRQDGGAL